MNDIQKTYLNDRSPGGRADLVKTDFDKLVVQKGRSIVHEIAAPCPCKSDRSNQMSDCKNCGGSGYVFMNPKATRMVLMGIDVSTKLVPWSEEVRGMVSFTALAEDEICLMDRITVTDAESIYSQVLHFKTFDDGTKFAYAAYKIKKILYAAKYESGTLPLSRLVEGADYTIDGNLILLSDAYNGVEDISITVRYKHAPAFHILELKRETMQSFRVEGRNELQQHFPVSGYARRAHYQLDAENLTNTRLLSNTYLASIDSNPFTNEVNQLLYNFHVVQGDAFQYTLRISENGDDVNVLLRSYKMQVRDSEKTLLLDFTVGNGILLTAPNYVSLSKTESQMNISPGIYFYDIEETIDGVKQTIQSGRFIISSEVTI